MSKRLPIAKTVVCIVIAAHSAVPQNHKTWTDNGGGPDNSHYSTLSQITRANVNQLSVAWSYPSNDNVSYVWNPLIVDNVVYVLARNNSLVALDAASGKEIWIHADLQGIAPRSARKAL